MFDYNEEAKYCGYALAEIIFEYNQKFGKNVVPTNKSVKTHIESSNTGLKADRKTINLVKHYAIEKLNS